MTVTKKRGDGVLRGAATHAQPRHLPRSPRQVSNGPTLGSRNAAVASTALARAPDANAGFEQGLDEGRATGLREGLQGAQQRIDEAMRAARQEFEQVAGQRLQEFKIEATARLAQLERVVADFEAAATRRVAELESDAIALAYEAVCKLLGEHAGDASTIAAMVRQGMAQLRGSALLAVRMNEADLRALLGDEQGRRLQASTPHVKWIADTALTAGGCLIDTPAGSLDARLETQLSALRTLWATPQGSTDSPARTR